MFSVVERIDIEVVNARCDVTSWRAFAVSWGPRNRKQANHEVGVELVFVPTPETCTGEAARLLSVRYSLARCVRHTA